MVGESVVEGSSDIGLTGVCIGLSGVWRRFWEDVGCVMVEVMVKLCYWPCPQECVWGKKASYRKSP